MLQNPLFLHFIVQFSSVAQSCLTLRPHESQHARPPCPSPSPGVHSDSHPSSRWCHPAISSSVVPFSSCPQSLPAKFLSSDSVVLSKHVILCYPLLLLPSVFPSIRVYSNGLVLPIRWPKYWSFRFNISPSNQYSRLVSFRIDWFDLLAAQGILKSLLQHHNSKASILWHSAFFTVQLSHPYMTTGKTLLLPQFKPFFT